MFHEDLSKALKDNHMSQKELASYLNTNQANVSKWVTGRTKPRDREFNMMCDLFELSRERYTAERAGVKPVEFTPKPYVNTEVKAKVDLSENPYKKKEEPFRCDTEIKKLKDDFEFLDCRFREFTKVVGKDMDTLTDEIVKKDKEIAELEEKITYLRGLIDGAYTDKPELEGKSWWQRLWS